MKAWSHLCALLSREPWWAELWCAGGVLAWAAYIWMLPNDLTLLPNYRVLSYRVTEDQMQWAALLVGGTQMLAVTLDRRVARRVCAAASGCFWLFLAHVLWLGAPAGPGGPAAVPGVVAHAFLGLQSLASVLLIRLAPMR